MQTTLTNEQINIISIATKNNIPLSTLGKTVGHSINYFYTTLRGYSETTLYQVAKALNVSVEELQKEPTVNIDSLPGNVGLLTRLRKICNYLYIGASRFHALTDIHINYAYIKKIPQERINTTAELLGVSKEYLLFGANTEAVEKKLQENRAYLIWKLAGYNRGEERDLIVALAKEARTTVYELQYLFRQNEIPLYLLRTSRKKSIRPNMTDTERKKIAALLNVSENKLINIQHQKKEQNSGQRLPAHRINKDYPLNLIADIEEELSLSGRITEADLEYGLRFLTSNQAYCIRERYERHKTITKIADQRHTSKKNIAECTKRAVVRMANRISGHYKGGSVELTDTKKSKYPDNLLKVLNRSVALDGVTVSVEAVEKIVAGLSEENQSLYNKLFIEGKTVAMIQEEMNLPAKERNKLHNKRHHLIRCISYHLAKKQISKDKESAEEKAFSTTA